jgi:hypothetical protein
MRAAATFITLAVCGALAAACASGGGGNETARSVLGGEWVYNSAASQNADSVAAGRGVGRGQRGGADGGMGGGRSGGGGGSFDPERIRTVMQAIAATRTALKVEQSDTAVVFTWGDGIPLPIRTNGKQTKRTIAALGEVEMKGEWKDGLLVVEQKLEGGAKLRSEYVRGPGSPRLIVLTTVSGGGPREFTIRSVYDAAT